MPPIPGLAGTPFWTNHEAIETEQVPQSLVVLGGGAVGAELTQVFARFGSRVSVAEGADRLLPLEEPEAGDLLAGVFAREGITVRTGRRAAGVAYSPGRGFTVTLDGGEELTGAALLVATGRRADLAAVGAGAVGIDEQPARPSLWTTTCGPRPACGRWATSPARVPSPTCPCTRLASSSTTSWGASTAAPSTTRCPGSPSPTRRSARWG